MGSNIFEAGILGLHEGPVVGMWSWGCHWNSCTGHRTQLHGI